MISNVLFLTGKGEEIHMDPNTYMQWQQPYQVAPMYAPPVKKKKEGNVYGLVSMILGVVAFFLFITCVNFIVGIISIVFGIIQIAQYQKKGLAITGIVTSCLSFLLGIIGWILFFGSISI